MFFPIDFINRLRLYY